MKKSKPKQIPYLFQDKVEATIERAKTAVESAQKRVQESKLLTERARQTVEDCKHKRRG